LNEEGPLLHIVWQYSTSLRFSTTTAGTSLISCSVEALSGMCIGVSLERRYPCISPDDTITCVQWRPVFYLCATRASTFVRRELQRQRRLGPLITSRAVPSKMAEGRHSTLLKFVLSGQGWWRPLATTSFTSQAILLLDTSRTLHSQTHHLIEPGK